MLLSYFCNGQMAVNQRIPPCACGARRTPTHETQSDLLFQGRSIVLRMQRQVAPTEELFPPSPLSPGGQANHDRSCLLVRQRLSVFLFFSSSGGWVKLKLSPFRHAAYMECTPVLRTHYLELE